MPTAVMSSQGAATALRFGRLAAMGVVAALILTGGVWASWGTAQYVMLTKGRESGTVTVSRCDDGWCRGAFTGDGGSAARRGEVVVEDSVAVEKGRTYAVVVKPGGAEAVRSGPAGVLYAWVPLGGALLLAAVVVAGGLRRTRLAWVMAGAGAALLSAAFVAV
ncbi:hypothetical protein [Streptomyces flavalbus]|uniref:DUF3592 domain-containing protein n=1 Tax=Streptomyces flavalbus TaxID=2665155 RepID=A0ABW2WAT2_9ACTN